MSTPVGERIFACRTTDEGKAWVDFTASLEVVGFDPDGPLILADDFHGVRHKLRSWVRASEVHVP